MLIVKAMWVPCFESVGPEFLPFVTDRVKSDRAEGSWVVTVAGEGVVALVQLVAVLVNGAEVFEYDDVPVAVVGVRHRYVEHGAVP